MEKEKNKILRKKFWKKLLENKRNFRWFYHEYIDGVRETGVLYPTLLQQANGAFIQTLSQELSLAMQEYLNEKS